MAVITGGASGIGWATAELFIARGWFVVIADKNHDRARARVAERSTDMESVALDVTSTQSVDAVFDAVGTRHGRLDALVNSAGIGLVVELCGLSALAFAIGLFFLVPVGLVSLIKSQLHSSTLFWLIEGVVRTAIFLGYLLVLSRMRDLRRVFEYHGAEHKTIACHEAGQELTPENAAAFSRLHPRCGTSFLLIVMIVAIFVFAPFGLPAWYWLFATRILGVPVIAGISFEIIKFAARHRERAWVRALMAPGLALQRLTTREPDATQLAVAIAALRSVLDIEAGDGGSAADLVGLEVVA